MLKGITTIQTIVCITKIWLCLGTSYEARVRTKTRHGVSHYSDTWQFSTWSPWTTSKPVTVFSLPR